MNSTIDLDKVVLVEKSKNDFFNKVNIDHFTNDNLDYLQFKYFFIEYANNYSGYVVIAETFNKISKITSWVLLNVYVSPQCRGRNVGSVTLEKVNSIFSKELGVNSYIVALNSFLMYKMIAREFKNGTVDFFCLINKNYSFEEMKEEEGLLEHTFRVNPEVHADMIVSFNKEESDKVKKLYFKY